MKKFITFLLLIVFSLNATQAASFSDIQKYRYKASVDMLKEQGIIGGYPDGTFQPEREINRAELTKIAVGSLGVDPNATEYRNCFPDVREEWFARFVCFAKEQNIIGGYPDGSFQPAKNINYVEALKITYEANQDTGKVNPKRQEWFAKYLEDAEESQIALTEFGNKLSTDVKRGEVAEIIGRFLNKKAQNKIVLRTTQVKYTLPETEAIDVETVRVSTFYSPDQKEEVQIAKDKNTFVAVEDAQNENIIYYNIFPDTPTNRVPEISALTTAASLVVPFVTPYFEAPEINAALQKLAFEDEKVQILASNIDELIKAKGFWDFEEITNEYESAYNSVVDEFEASSKVGKLRQLLAAVNFSGYDLKENRANNKIALLDHSLEASADRIKGEIENKSFIYQGLILNNNSAILSDRLNRNFIEKADIRIIDENITKTLKNATFNFLFNWDGAVASTKTKFGFSVKQNDQSLDMQVTPYTKKAFGMTALSFISSVVALQYETESCLRILENKNKGWLDNFLVTISTGAGEVSDLEDINSVILTTDEVNEASFLDIMDAVMEGDMTDFLIQCGSNVIGSYKKKGFFKSAGKLISKSVKFFTGKPKNAKNLQVILSEYATIEPKKYTFMLNQSVSESPDVQETGNSSFNSFFGFSDYEDVQSAPQQTSGKATGFTMPKGYRAAFSNYKGLTWIDGRVVGATAPSISCDMTTYVIDEMTVETDPLGKEQARWQFIIEGDNNEYIVNSTDTGRAIAKNGSVYFYPPVKINGVWQYQSVEEKEEWLKTLSPYISDLGSLKRSSVPLLSFWHFDYDPESKSYAYIEKDSSDIYFNGSLSFKDTEGVKRSTGWRKIKVSGNHYIANSSIGFVIDGKWYDHKIYGLGAETQIQIDKKGNTLITSSGIALFNLQPVADSVYYAELNNGHYYIALKNSIIVDGKEIETNAHNWFNRDDLYDYPARINSEGGHAYLANDQGLFDSNLYFNNILVDSKVGRDFRLIGDKVLYYKEDGLYFDGDKIEIPGDGDIKRLITRYCPDN